MFADVIVDIQHEKLDKIFQYRIPESMEGKLEPGMEVLVPTCSLRKRKPSDQRICDRDFRNM